MGASHRAPFYSTQFFLSGVAASAVSVTYDDSCVLPRIRKSSVRPSP
jgi:hypothetical protein